MKKFLIIVLGLVVLYFGFKGYTNIAIENRLLNAELTEAQAELVQTSKELAEKDAAMTEVEMRQKVLKRTRQKAVSFNEEMQNEIELTVLTTQGEYSLKHDKAPDARFFKWLVGSEANVTLEFKAGISIPTEFIWAQVDDDGNFIVFYDVEKLKIAYVEIANLAATQSCGPWGVPYSAEEISALTMIGKEDIETALKDRNDLFDDAEENLILEIQRIAKQFFDGTINVKRYSMR